MNKVTETGCFAPLIWFHRKHAFHYEPYRALDPDLDMVVADHRNLQFVFEASPGFRGLNYLQASINCNHLIEWTFFLWICPSLDTTRNPAFTCRHVFHVRRYSTGHTFCRIQIPISAIHVSSQLLPEVYFQYHKFKQLNIRWITGDAVKEVQLLTPYRVILEWSSVPHRKQLIKRFTVCVYRFVFQRYGNLLAAAGHGSTSLHEALDKGLTLEGAPVYRRCHYPVINKKAWIGMMISPWKKQLSSFTSLVREFHDYLMCTVIQ